MATTKIVFLILPQMYLLDMAGADQVFYEAIDHGADIEIDYCAIGERVETSNHLAFEKTKHYSNIKIGTGDYLFVPGAALKYLVSKTLAVEKALFKWVNDCYANGAFVCSICTGAFFLGLTKLLDGRKCTTHWKRAAELKQKFPAINLIENILFTEDDRILTSAGVTAGIDMALYIVSKLKDDNFSYKVARELVVYVRRHANDAQQSVFMNYRNHIHSGIHKAQDYLQDNIDKKITLDELAGIAYMSPRNFTRVFKKETSISVNEYITLIRKEHLRELLKNPDITRKQMAKHCGLKSERQVIRLLNKSNL